MGSEMGRTEREMGSKMNIRNSSTQLYLNSRAASIIRNVHKEARCDIISRTLQEIVTLYAVTSFHL